MKLIKIDSAHFIIVDDSEIKVGDWIFYPVTKTILRWNGNMPLRNEDLKLTHSTIGYMFQDDILPLSQVEVEELVYGYSVEKRANSHAVQSGCEYKEDLVRISKAYQTGFKAHQELVKDKLFTVEDIEEAHKSGIEYGKSLYSQTNYDSKLAITSKQYIQSLLPKTEWNISIDEYNKITLL